MSSDSRIQKATEYQKQAEKKISKWIYLSGNKYEDAKELYEKAANLYKMCKQYQEAAEMYEKMVFCFMKLGDSRYEAASAYVDAANMYKKASKADAIEALQKAIILFTEDGKFTTAAKHEQEVAELYEEMENLQKAVEHYKIAKDYFENENAKSSALKCLVALGHIEATREEYDAAIEAFESAGNMCVDDKLLAWSAKEYFFKAALCHLCKEEHFEDMEPFKETLESYVDTDVHFQECAEHRLLESMINAIQEQNITELTNAIRDYNNLKKLDSWKTTILLRVKKAVQESAANPSLV